MERTPQLGTYNVDVCLVIDKTGSMKPIMDTVKENALNLYEDVRSALEVKGKHISRFRIRVIWFGDYKADKYPMILSDFLNMPEDLSKYEEFVNGVNPGGGGDAPEDGLEALAYAIRSPWCTDGWRKRHIIALFTDAPAHDLGYCKSAPTYPKAGMPADFSELTEMWGDADYPGEMDNHAKRLLLFAPNTSYWAKIVSNWDNVVLRGAELDNGLQEISYQTMMDTIASSV